MAEFILFVVLIDQNIHSNGSKSNGNRLFGRNWCDTIDLRTFFQVFMIQTNSFFRRSFAFEQNFSVWLWNSVKNEPIVLRMTYNYQIPPTLSLESKNDRGCIEIWVYLDYFDQKCTTWFQITHFWDIVKKIYNFPTNFIFESFQNQVLEKINDFG